MDCQACAGELPATALVTAQLQGLALGIDNILFAIDWPYEPNTTGMDFLHKLSISDADREKIAHGNAERILRV